MAISVNSIYSQLTLYPQVSHVGVPFGVFKIFMFPQIKSNEGLKLSVSTNQVRRWI